jgi:hypothetical protein
MDGTMTVQKSTNILTSKQEIMDYLGGISNHLFMKYVNAGMPARFEDNRWIAHTNVIEEWCRAYTRVSMKHGLESDPR